MPRKVALIGVGAIANEIFKGLMGNPEIKITQVLVRPERMQAVRQRLGTSADVITSADDLDHETDCVLECAGHEAVRQYAPDILSRSMNFALLSAGALADQETYDALTRACKTGCSRLSILPGAIGGIDALAAAGDALDQVNYSACKPPKSWLGSPAEETHDLAAITAQTEIFSGTARSAAIGFPKNANVVATVALAGIGFERTRVKLVADPAATGNTHTITAKGALFDLHYKTTGHALPDNPKTSALTALSALRSLRNTAPGITV